MKERIYKNDTETTEALAELGLTQAIIREAVVKGEVARDSCTANDPPNTPGFDAWAKTVRALREILIPKQWSKNDDRNFSTVVSPDGSIAIAVATGDDGTGQAKARPRTKYPKGVATKTAIENNQMCLFPFRVEVDQDELRLTWMLLRRRDRDSVFVELSLPTSITEDGQVNDWETRIILDPIEIDPTVMTDNDESQSDDVPVRRRS